METLQQIQASLIYKTNLLSTSIQVLNEFSEP